MSDFEGNNAKLLNYLWNEHNQTLNDAGCCFKWDLGPGHIEFYQFGERVAAPIYESFTNRRLELLVVDSHWDKSYIDLCVREMVQMIERKRSRVEKVARRIKR